jgi:hypothetical protein
MRKSHLFRQPAHPASSFCRNIPAIVGWRRLAAPPKRRSKDQVDAMVDVAFKTEIYLWSHLDKLRGRSEASESLDEVQGVITWFIAEPMIYPVSSSKFGVKSYGHNLDFFFGY